MTITWQCHKEAAGTWLRYVGRIAAEPDAIITISAPAALAQELRGAFDPDAGRVVAALREALEGLLEHHELCDCDRIGAVVDARAALAGAAEDEEQGSEQEGR